VQKEGEDMASHPIYEFYAELAGYHPKIWRRFQVFDNITMARLGYILMTLFEMKASHLFRIEVPAEANFRAHISKILGDDGYACSCAEWGLDELFGRNMIFEVITENTLEFSNEDEKVYDATKYRLKNVIFHTGSKLLFVYDFGDNWIVEVTLERIFNDPDLPGRLLPRVIEGEGFGIVEDCGGVTGLAKLAKAFKEKKGKEYHEYSSWLGVDDFDIESFDIDDMNFRLSKIPRIYSDIYEYNLEPTKRSMDILERRYLKRKNKS